MRSNAASKLENTQANVVFEVLREEISHLKKVHETMIRLHVCVSCSSYPTFEGVHNRRYQYAH